MYSMSAASPRSRTSIMMAATVSINPASSATLRAAICASLRVRRSPSSSRIISITNSILSQHKPERADQLCDGLSFQLIARAVDHEPPCRVCDDFDDAESVLRERPPGLNHLNASVRKPDPGPQFDTPRP